MAEEYSTKALYDVIRHSLLVKDKDLMHFIRTMNDNILDDIKKLKKLDRLSINDILDRFESYGIVIMMVRRILQDAKISMYQEKSREITDYLLNDELSKNKEKPSSPSYYDEE
jgi:uncharacterized membrane protein YheB (UPF0754 family)